MNLYIHNRQKKRRPNIHKLAKLARFFMLRAMRCDPGSNWDDVVVVLVDDARMTALNRLFLDHADTTDVITFTLASATDAVKGRSAEIYVNMERVLEAGPRHKGITAELALYVAHGCDHLTGADDHTRLERRRMRAREQRWLRQARQAGLMTGLWGRNAE